tara:strand:+ start:1151 stop:1471 length:321 start_codon:yes stop_codon:yes gene_type:complete
MLGKIMEKAITQNKKREETESLWIAVIQQNFEDAFELNPSGNISMADIQIARNWFYTKRCAEICEYVGTTRDHIQRLYHKLSDRYKAGLITKDELRLAIRKLEKKL